MARVYVAAHAADEMMAGLWGASEHATKGMAAAQPASGCVDLRRALTGRTARHSGPCGHEVCAPQIRDVRAAGGGWRSSEGAWRASEQTTHDQTVGQ